MFRRKLLKTAAVLAVAAFIAAGGRWVAGVRAIGDERARIASRIAELQPTIQEGAEIDARRNLAGIRDRFLDRMASNVEWAEALRSLSLVVPSTAVFESIEVRNEDSISLTITGTLRGEEGRPTADFNQFLNSLRAIPHFSSVEMSRPLNVSSEAGPTDAEQTPSGPISRVAFEVRCVLISNS